MYLLDILTVSPHFQDAEIKLTMREQIGKSMDARKLGWEAPEGTHNFMTSFPPSAVDLTSMGTRQKADLFEFLMKQGGELPCQSQI